MTSTTGAPAEHRLDEADREALDDARQDDHGPGRVCLGDARHLRPADLLEGDRVVADRVQSFRLVGKELGRQGLAVGEIGRTVRPLDGRADDPQHRPGLLLADLREGVQQRDQILGGLDPPDPDQRDRIGASPSLAHVPEAGRVHARIDRTEFGAVGAAPLLPAAGVHVAGRDERGLPVDLGREPTVERR